MLLKFLVFLFFSLHAVWAKEETYNESILLKIDKQGLKAYLETLPSNLEQGRLLAEFPIAIGKNQGDKLQAGDNRTPEGIYFTRTHLPKEHLLKSMGQERISQKYGELAIPISFPNPFDRYENKTGSGIWLHGAGDDKRMEEKNVTEGCVAFFNADILKLSKWLNPSYSVVVSAHDSKAINTKEDRSGVFAVYGKWLAS